MDFTLEEVGAAGKTSTDEATVLGAPMDWEAHMQTPSDAIILRPLPTQPKKRRKLTVDKNLCISKDISNKIH